jgi:hypothetical protein
VKQLFQQDLKVVNLGLQGFANNIAAAGGYVTHLSWAPPAGADAALGWTLACMIGDSRIERANRTAYERYLAAQPRLADLVLARDAIPGLGASERPDFALGTANRLAGHVWSTAGCDHRRHSLRGLGEHS